MNDTIKQVRDILREAERLRSLAHEAQKNVQLMAMAPPNDLMLKIGNREITREQKAVVASALELQAKEWEKQAENLEMKVTLR